MGRIEKQKIKGNSPPRVLDIIGIIESKKIVSEASRLKLWAKFGLKTATKSARIYFCESFQ